MRYGVVKCLTVTLRDYPTPTIRAGEKSPSILKYCIWDIRSQIWYSVIILNIIRMSYRLSKNVISGSFPVYEILKFSFPVFVHVTNRRRIKFQGEFQGVFSRSKNASCPKSQFLTSLAKNRQLVGWLLIKTLFNQNIGFEYWTWLRG